MKNKKWKAMASILILSMLGLMVSGCGKKEESVEESTEISVEELIIEVDETEEEIEEVVETPENVNLLTGVADLTDEAIGMRPVAVMVSNVDAAMPQYGISDSDLIIEMPVEGGLTRFMAFYADYTQVPDICSVRSCRDYFPSVSEGFDAIYIHWGMDESIRDHYNAMDLDVFNGTYGDGGIFDRDSERRNSGYAIEHTSMIYGGDVLVNAIQAESMRTELLDEKKETMFLFHPEGEIVKPTGEDCTYVKADFGAVTSGFTYKEDEQVYYKDYNGEVQADGVTDIQLSFTNVIILEATITPRSDSPGRVAIACYGVSDQVGYYVSNGVVQEIRWSKEDEDADLKLYDLNGEELVLNAGRSYIGFNYAGEAVYE